MADNKRGHAEHIKVAENLGIYDSIQRPLKIVFLGAGSGFFKHLFKDVLNIPGAEKGEMWLVDIDEERLDLSARLGEMLNKALSKQWTIHATTERRDALKDADYVINCIEVSGIDCVRFDNNIPAKYGVTQCIGDTLGPGGLFKALRTAPIILDTLKDMEELCPDTQFLNYTNPMSMICLSALRASKIKTVGLCHSVQGTSHQLADYLEIPYQELHWKVGGINHLAWFTKLKRNGKEDLYPLLREIASKKGEIYEKDPVRFDMMLHFGHFVTESSGHFSEYLPYYRKHPETLKEFCREGYRGESGFYANNWPKWHKEHTEDTLNMVTGKKELNLQRSWEYASYIIEAIETNRPFTAHCTVRNTNLIPNLPTDNVVEVACMVDRNGVTPTYFGELPSQCAAICQSNMQMINLVATACIEKSKEAAIHALMLDPLTSAVCAPNEIKEMFEEMFEAEKEFLPYFL